MAFLELYEAFLAFFCFLIFSYLFVKKPYYYLCIKKSLKSYPWNWPVLGMLPGVLVRIQRIYGCSVEVLENSNMTFPFKGPWYAGMDMLVTVDPSNIHHIMSSNFSNYIKGPELHEILEVFGDGIINTDCDLWKNLRKSSHMMFSHQGFQRLSMSTTRSKIKDGLLPLFNHFAEEGKVMDLQDVIQRFMLDTTFIFVTGYDPRSLSIEMPKAEFANALKDVSEGLLYRIITPRVLWKLQSWMGIWKEKKMTEAGLTFDRVCAKYISAKREEIQSQETNLDKCFDGEDILTSHIKLDKTKYELLDTSDDKFLRDVILTLVTAGREATASALTWFFWLLTENPKVVSKILEEINMNLPNGQETLSSDNHNMDYLNKLVYLHGALYEAMRLYPPIPFERKSPIKQDVLPSGHKVEANSVIMIFIYALGRMRSVWGEDAMEFKPERWISETGRLRHEPSFKFLVFNAGPRTCLGKNLAMNMMKTVVVEVLRNYDIKLVEGQKIEAFPSLTLHMRHGLRVTVSKRCSA